MDKSNGDEKLWVWMVSIFFLSKYTHYYWDRYCKEYSDKSEH